ncbi:hypothetical protein [Collimonas humicola]|uniref:hypothetical protein n=1 Tax=Collimonas humicola TaxID=2825886 RepID=UPI001B8B2DAE|nr:hypothetical protein [Collimonas humicola]
MATRKNKSSTELDMDQKKDGPIAGLVMIIFGVGYPCYMFDTWIHLAPIAIGRYHHAIITWEARPILYSVSMAMTIIGCLGGVCYGLSRIVNYRYFLIRFFRRRNSVTRTDPTRLIELSSDKK